MIELFRARGHVVKGKRIGTGLGFPTANLHVEASQGKAKNGVYVALARLEGQQYLAIVNQGTHPTFPEGQPTVEAYLLDYTGGDTYGKELEVSFVAFLRGETRFEGPRALAEQLQKDCAGARLWAKENQPAVLKGEPMENPIEVQQAVYAYEEEAENAVDGVSLTIPKGQFVAVLGHNGSGKSTLAKLMNALYLPNEGRVLVCGLDTAQEERVWDIRKHAGMVFQNPDNQIVATVVREDVAFGLENMGVPQPEMVPRIDRALEDVSMTEFAAAAPHMLSGGQKQRVAIAGVLAMAPEVMILDEATAMLDPSGRQEVFDTVRTLNRERGITVVWITHFMEEAALADRVVVLSKGKIVMDNTPEHVFSRVDEIKALGLDVPPMAELAKELTQAGLPMPEGILTVPEMVKELKEKLCP